MWALNTSSGSTSDVKNGLLFLYRRKLCSEVTVQGLVQVGVQWAVSWPLSDTSSPSFSAAIVPQICPGPLCSQEADEAPGGWQQGAGDRGRRRATLKAAQRQGLTCPSTCVFLFLINTFFKSDSPWPRAQAALGGRLLRSGLTWAWDLPHWDESVPARTCSLPSLLPCPALVLSPSSITITNQPQLIFSVFPWGFWTGLTRGGLTSLRWSRGQGLGGQLGAWLGTLSPPVPHLGIQEPLALPLL